MPGTEQRPLQVDPGLFDRETTAGDCGQAHLILNTGAPRAVFWPPRAVFWPPRAVLAPLLYSQYTADSNTIAEFADKVRDKVHTQTHTQNMHTHTSTYTHT